MAEQQSARPIDLVNDPIPGLIRYIAIPASIGTIFTTMYNVVDTFWAGQLSTDSLAALSLNFPLYMVVMAIGVGFSQGANALISNYLGAREEDRARHIFAQAISFTVIAQIMLSVPPVFPDQADFFLHECRSCGNAQGLRVCLGNRSRGNIHQPELGVQLGVGCPGELEDFQEFTDRRILPEPGTGSDPDAGSRDRRRHDHSRS
jgi:hypothetical protein